MFHLLTTSPQGGRQLDTARSGIEILAEVAPVLREKGLENKLEIFIDGGVRRATDIIKALCLGATAVGIGRPFLFAMSSYGQPGVDRAMRECSPPQKFSPQSVLPRMLTMSKTELLKDEMEMNMRLIGAAKIEDLRPDMVDITSAGHHGAGPSDNLSYAAYDRLITPYEMLKSKL